MKIVAGVYTARPDPKFWPMFLRFYVKNEKRFNMGFAHVHGRPTAEAQKEVVYMAQLVKATHLLFVEDDATYVPNDILEKLVEADKDVIAPHAYSRHYPYQSMILAKRFTNMTISKGLPAGMKARGNLIPLNDKEGIVEADLVHFNFTLVKMEVFNKISKPWFAYGEVGETDCWFCDKLLEAGIHPYGHMGIRLTHSNVDDHTKPFLLEMHGPKLLMEELDVS